MTREINNSIINSYQSEFVILQFSLVTKSGLEIRKGSKFGLSIYAKKEMATVKTDTSMNDQ